VDRLAGALASALNGGPAVLPSGDDSASPPAGPVPDPGADAALLVRTSGSTGPARLVVLSAAALRASATATHARLGGPGRWLLALPAQHVAGAQVIVRALLAGHRPVVLDTRGGFRPERFAEAATSLPGPRRYTSLVPTQLHRVLAAGDPAALAALRRFDAVLVGGAAIPPALLAAARAAGVTVVTTYGMSETAGGCVYDGVPLDGVGVRLAEPDGRIWLAGPTLARGYLGAAEQTAEAFVDGWFRTSDLGEWVDPPSARSGPPGGARLRVLGRADDIITTGGVKVHPSAVERVLAAQPGVRAACVVGLPDPEWGQRVVAAVVVEHGAPDERGLGASVRAALGPASVPKLIRALPELPLRGVGKPDRAEVARLLDA
jgi:O-succinylbenzoic acid--CoA ligase